MPGIPGEIVALAEAPPQRRDTLLHLQFTESDCPEMAKAAWRLHAQGYRDSGFVTESAIVDGIVSADIDKSRGPNTDYYLGLHTPTGEYKATMRKRNLAPGESYRDLPAYELSKDGLSPMGHQTLADLHAQGVSIKEIAAMARAPGSSPLGMFEVIRNVLHGAIGKNEAWIFSVVSDTYDSLARSWGLESLPVIGDDVKINDPRVNAGISLRPAMLFPDTFNDSILKSYEQAKAIGNTEAAAILRRSFLFFTEGLDDTQMSLPVSQARRELSVSQSLDSKKEIVMTTAAETNVLNDLLAAHIRQPDVWAEPQMFDPSDPADRAALEAKFQEGAIQGVVDNTRAIADELFELRHPDQMGNAEMRKGFVDDIMAKGSRFGRWFLFPWSGQLVKYAEQEDHQALRTSRNRNLVSEEDQARLYGATVFVGGLSVGSNIVRELVRAGIGGTHVLADMDVISVSNLNRIDGGMTNVGQTKVDHAAIQISDADPYLKQVHFREGITSDNIEELSQNKPDIIFDEVDSLPAKIALRKYAQREGIPVVMVTDVDERTVVDVERYDLGGAKPFHGRLSKKLIERISNGTATPSQMKGAMVKIVGLGNVSTRMLQSFLNVGTTLSGMSQLGRTASEGGAKAATVATEILLGREMPTGRYRGSAVDTLKLKRDKSLTNRVKAIARLVKMSARTA